MTFRRKTTWILISITAGLTLALAGLVYPRAYREQLEGVRQRVQGIAATAALSIDNELHQRVLLHGLGEALLKEPDYQTLQEQLRKILGANPGVRYAWTMVRGKARGEMIFVGDIGGKEAHPGLPYDASRIPDLWMGLKEPAADRTPVKDPWGTSISGYAPIRNKQGEFVAVLGVDVYAQELEQFQQRFRQFLGFSLLAGLLLAVLLGSVSARWISQPIDRLIHGMRQVEAGDLTHQVELKSGDEFEEAAGAFNRMTDGLRKAREELRTAFLKTVQSLVSALEAKDPYTRGHSTSVTHYATEMARVLGRPTAEIEMLGRLAVLHDIGKIGIHDQVLLKPGVLTSEERQSMQHHPTIGAKILAPLGLSPEELTLIVSHHEWEDGRGYPAGLDRSKISDLVAIVSVADAYDAMTSNRSYRHAMKPADALAELRRGVGTQFRKEIVEALATILQKQGVVS